jgi:hypothetical protein
MLSGELQTHAILEKSFQLGMHSTGSNLEKRVFVPFITGPDMKMIETYSLADIASFTPNRWGIPEPQYIDGRSSGTGSSNGI